MLYPLFGVHLGAHVAEGERKMIRKRLSGPQLGAATLFIVCGSFAGYAFGHALGQRGAVRGVHQQPLATPIRGLVGQAIVSVPTQKQAVATPPTAQPVGRSARTRAASRPSTHRGKGGAHDKGHGKGGGD